MTWILRRAGGVGRQSRLVTEGSTATKRESSSESGTVIQLGSFDSNPYVELERSDTNAVPNHAADRRISDANFHLILYRQSKRY